MVMRKKNILKSILIIILVCFVVVAIIGAIIKNNTHNVANAFSLSVGDDVVTSSSQGYYISKDSPLVVDVLFPSTVSKEDMTYEYKLDIAEGYDFKYYVGYERHSFSEKFFNLYDVFDISLTDTGLAISSKVDSLSEFLSFCYPKKEIRLIDESSIDYDKSMFLLVVKAKTGEVVSIGFSFRLAVSSVSTNIKDIVL